MAETPHPLADRMRPRSIEEIGGQDHLLGAGKPLRLALDGGRVHSMIFWGPPGTGKTTLARLVAGQAALEFISISAVLGGVKEVRAAIESARRARDERNIGTVLFIDEVHRFNKSQQDAFLPHVEDGTVVFIGATTENPAFEVNNALLSRARVYVLESLATDALRSLLDRALADSERGLGALSLTVEEGALDLLANGADGDARRALTMLEIVADVALSRGDAKVSEKDVADALAGGGIRRFDKGGDAFYDLISALHKSIRGSDPDAALYWLARMLDGGADPLYLGRRLMRMASEDVGNADPRALAIAISAFDVQTRLGSPEGELALAQAAVYLACAAKSNAVYKGFNQAMADVREQGSKPVPPHLRNAPTRLAKSMGHGFSYRYAHDEPGGYAAGEQYLPEGMQGTRYYSPVDRGLEIRIAEKLERLRELDRAYRERSSGRSR